MADLDVIIVSFNSAAYLDACLASIFAHAGDAELEVVVVDNGSVDGSSELVEEHFPRVRVLRGENRGFAYANNRGFEVTDSDYVLFVNPDVEIRDGTFGEMIRQLEARPRTGLLGCRQLDEDGSLFPTIRRFPSPTRSLCEAVGSERLPVQASWMGERQLHPVAYERECHCDWLSGSFMLARRAAVRDVGMMDERFFLFSEETDLCAGMKDSGWEVRYLPAMTILHYFGKNGYSERLAAQEAYARRQYLFKRESVARRALSTAALALFYARRAVASLGRDEGSRSKRAAGRAALRTILGMAPPPFGELSGPVSGPRHPELAPPPVAEALDQAPAT